MRELAGKTAFVTGGASGIGLALGRALAEAGTKVMLADIEEQALAAAVTNLRAAGASVAGVPCDVADAASVARAAAATVAAFGKVHVLCNNAGVGGGSGTDAIALDTWRWVVDVNLMGVVHGIHAFLPHLRAHGEAAHIVNTASLAGLMPGLGFSPYGASKFAVVGLSEGLAQELAPVGIGVSVVCPGFVRTRIAESARNRPPRYGPAHAPAPGSWGDRLAAALAQGAAVGLDPAVVAALTVDAIRRNELYVFPHPERHAELGARFAAILAAMEQAAARQPPAPAVSS